MAFSFSTMPSVAISRSKFDRVSRHPLSFNLGQIVPLYVDEVLPGDTRKLELSTLVRMSTPIAPIMDDIEMDLFAFFVPNRLCFDHWKEVMGENNSGAGIYTGTPYVVPKVTITNGSMPVGSIGDHMGLPNVSASYAASVLPLRAYKLIYNRWFRNQSVTAPVAVDISSTTTYDDYTINPYIAAKKADYFTKSLPYAQKGNPVTIPLGTTAPVYSRNQNVPTSLIQAPLLLGQSSAGGWAHFDGHVGTDGAGSTRIDSTAIGSGSNTQLVTAQNLWADLTNATAATINQLRLAFQTQKLLEKDALYGTRYWEILYAHFGVQSPDASLQDPEYLGGAKFMINIDQVLQTTGYDDSASSELAQVGANSVTGWKGNLFTKSFVEHGWLMVLGVARQKHRTYGQGLNRMFARSGRYDFYFPVFANLGAQDVKNDEIFAGTAGNFGYQEAWAEYRYKPSIVSGILNPARSNSLDYWTLAEAFAACPTLGDNFIKEDRANLSRALTTGVSGPDFIADFYFKDVSVRPMPTYSIPGLIDHH